MEDKDNTREHLLPKLENLRKELAELKAGENERKWVDAALRESEERYRRLLESITDYIYTVKVENGRPVSTMHGPGCFAVTGYTSDYLLVYPYLWYEMIHEEDRESVLKQAEKILSDEAVKPIEHRIIHKDGSVRWVRNTPVPHYDKDGELIAYDGIIEDITERKEAEEALKESFKSLERAKKEWTATFDGITDPLFIHDKDMRLVRVNRAYADAAGSDFKEMLGRPYYEVFPKMCGPFRMCLKAQELQEEFSYPLTNQIFKIRFYPIKDVNGKYLYSIHILEDITEAKRSAEKLREEMDVTSHLLMIAEAIARTTDIDELMGQVVHCCQKILECDICLSYLWDKESRVFRPCKAYGLKRESIPVFMTESMDEKVGFVREAMKKKEPIVMQSGVWSQESGERPLAAHMPNTGSQASDALPFSWLPDANTIAFIPLIWKKGPLGLIVGIYTGASSMHRQAQHEQEKAARPELVEGKPIFTGRDIEVMQGIMHQVSVAIEEARLYADSIDRAMELSHKIETIQAMNEIDRNILSTLDPQMVLDTSARMIGRVITCDMVTIVSVSMEREMYSWVAGFGTEFLPKLRTAPFDATSATETVIRQGRPEFVANIMDINDPLPVEKGLIKEGFFSHIRVPLTVKGEIVGVLSIGAKRPSAFTPEDLATLEKMAYQIGVALSNARLLSDLEELFLGTVKSLSSAIDAKSPWTAGHSERVTKYALDIAKEMRLGRDEMRSLELAGLLHDIGKIGTYDILLDKPGRLEPEEIEIVRLHPGKGAEILEPISKFGNIIPAIRHHHEFYNGTGYPDRLKGEDIPLLARILAVADTFDAMAADRPYRKGRPMDYIISEFKRCSGTQFDPKVVDAFLTLIGGEKEEFKMAAN